MQPAKPFGKNLPVFESEGLGLHANKPFCCNFGATIIYQYRLFTLRYKKT